MGENVIARLTARPRFRLHLLELPSREALAATGGLPRPRLPNPLKRRLEALYDHFFARIHRMLDCVNADGLVESIISERQATRITAHLLAGSVLRASIANGTQVNVNTNAARDPADDEVPSQGPLRAPNIQNTIRGFGQ